MSLQGCSQFTIDGGSFNAITGPQHVYNGKVVQIVRGQGVRGILDEYQEVPVGKVYLKRKIADTTLWGPKNGRRKLDARQTIHTIRICGEDKEEEFMHIQYSGCDAAKAYKLDFDAFSTVKDINCVQLFGYSNLNALPALIFYDALVPVSHIWERNKFSSVLYTYLSYHFFSQAVVVQGLDDTLSIQELWMDPKIGFLRTGPVVGHSSNVDYRLSYFMTPSPPCDPQHPSLTLQTFNDRNVLFDYLKGTLPISSIVQGIRLSHNVIFDWPNDENTKLILALLPGTIYHLTSGEIIARYPGSREKWYYGFWETHSSIPDALQGSTLFMDDGSVRFTLKPSNTNSLESFELRYGLWPEEDWMDFADSWLSQAHGIFSQLGIGTEEWGEYSILARIWLGFERDEKQEASHIRVNTSDDKAIYFFVRPIPLPCDDLDTWDLWLSNARYYWSFDPCGVEEMSEHERLNLGLPAFTTTIEVWHRLWDYGAYDALEMVHRSQGFESASMELARSLGCSILEVVSGSSRFDEVNDTTDGYHISDMVEYPTTERAVRGELVTLEGDTEDDEVVLYPRSSDQTTLAFQTDTLL